MSSPSKPARLALGCAAAAAIVCAVAILDYSHAVGQVPPVPEPEPCPATAARGSLEPCNGTRNATLDERQDRVTELDDAYEQRLVLYSLAIAAIGMAYLLLRLRTLPPDGRRTAFTDLGVAGVAWLIVVLAAFAVQAESSNDPFDPSIGAPLAAGGVLLLVAALGSLVTWSGPLAGGTHPPLPRLPLAAKVGAGLTGAAILISTVAAGEMSGCSDPRPEWVDTSFIIAFAAAVGAVLCGVVALFQRRWFASLLLLGVAPFWVFVAAIVAACLS